MPTVTPIGTDAITALSRRYISPKIADNVYPSNPCFFRLDKMNKKSIQGGTQVELPLMYKRLAAGGFYSGFQNLDITPSDTIQNAAFAWSQAWAPVTIDGLSLRRSDSPEAVAFYLTQYFAQAQMDLAETLGEGLWTLPPLPNPNLQSIPAAVDNGTLASSYGGIAHNTLSVWNAQIDNTTTTLTFAAMQALFGAATFGGRHPTVIYTDQHEFNIFLALFANNIYYQRGPGGMDETLAQGGWTNALFNNIPVIVDSHVPTNVDGNGSDAHSMWMLNENYLQYIVPSDVDFLIRDFVTPPNQDVITSLVMWAGVVAFNNLNTQAALWKLS